ncbi:hypothetical protein EC973_005476 [Apophysomyces ossiformis]|uniref:Enoyl reductase (ER) domain-containing protein n=1 Tax=Apophysomyces ossiformis TaxID=679940 RepID=A0A8H7EPC5_9FUNG|nr:hypothetical protein EC973_008137 [Apophysomyces ossiformis]KAF7728850.1 hypothetical protein EC973_005476 [Apophysomyces ossiformis]
MVKNTQIIFSKVPTGLPVDGEHLQIRTNSIDLEAPLSEGELIVKHLHISVDPYMRNRMRDASIESYFPAFELDKPLSGHVVGVVLKSNNPNYKPGDIVTGFGAHEEYSRLSAAQAEASYRVREDIKKNKLPLSHYVGVLGMPGLTAYVGLLRFGQPKAGETLYISAASGAVGQLVGQIGKVLGLYVVGSAGSDDKVAHLKEIGFDAAFNYKSGALDALLAEHCPKGIDIYFENVGGAMLEAVIEHANNFARIVVSGMISQYNKTKPDGIHNLLQVIAKRLRIEGFIVTDHNDLEPEFTERVTNWLLEGKVKYRETIAEGIEKAPSALIDVLEGRNFGKQVVKVADL